MKKIYRARYTFMLRNPGTEKEGAFLVEACNFWEALDSARSYFDKCIFAEIKIFEGLDLVGEVVAR